MNFTPDASGLKLGPYWIRPGLTRGNVGTVLFASLLSISMTVYLALIQPYVLNEIVQVPESRQGTVTGLLVVWSEVLAICMVGFVGVFADRVGRRVVFTLGFVLLGCGYLLYPLATDEFQLFLFRTLFAFGLASVPVTLSITVQDTPQEISRGKWIATNNIVQGLGILVISTAILGRAPTWFQAAGFDPAMAGRLSLWCAAALCMLAAVVLWNGLPRKIRGSSPKKEKAVFSQLLEGLREGRRNPRLAVAFGAAFIGRGDLVIVGNFLTLWVTQYGIEQGLSTAAASGRAFMLFGIVQISALAWAGIMGFITDRATRMTALCIALALATLGYSWMGQVPDPLMSSAIPIAVLVGIGEVSVIVTGGALLGQEAKASMRGTIVGVFNLCGAVGIVVISGLGGWLFDTMGRATPFTVMGALNGILLLVALIVRSRAGLPESSPDTATADAD